MFADDPKRNQDNVPWLESIHGIALELGWYSLPDKYVNQPMTNVSRREPTGPTSGRQGFLEIEGIHQGLSLINESYRIM